MQLDIKVSYSVELYELTYQIRCHCITNTKPGINMDLSNKKMKGAKRREPRKIETQYLKVRGEAARKD